VRDDAADRRSGDGMGTDHLANLYGDVSIAFAADAPAILASFLTTVGRGRRESRAVLTAASTSNG
jgi:hypothetical protein